jgi:Trypsin-like peptidase domain
VSGKTIARVIIAILAGVALGGAIMLVINPRPFLPPLPPPPRIDVERGDPPTSVVAFEERIRTDGGYGLVGSGFLLELPNGDVIGVTTAHSLGGRDFAPMAFRVAGRGETVATFSEAYLARGQPRTGDDMTIDYVLLRPDAPPAPVFVLRPDPRGGPQPGERVSLYSGLGDPQGTFGSGHSGQRILPGTVESVDDNGAWVRMDGIFDPGQMSGSPMISQHTGRVVGMTIAVSPRQGALSIGINPIGAILARAMSK